MIASVRGLLAAKGEDHLIVEVGGIGLKIFAPVSLIGKLGNTGQEVALSTHLVVRENDLSLYGFGSSEEMRLFQLLLRVSGVGPRTALNIMSFVAPETLKDAISRGDAAALGRIPGVGKKTAERVVVDLRGKFGAEFLQQASGLAGLTAAETEVIAALTSLGYSVIEAQRAVRALPNEKLELEEQIRLALQYLGSG